MAGAGAGGIRAGRAFVEVFAKTAALERGLRAAEKRLKAFGSAVSGVGRRMAGLGVAMATPLALAGKTFAGFEQQMARVRAVSGASAEDFARLGAKAKELGAATVFSASQAAEAMGNFALAGYDVDTILKAVGPTLDLAAAGQIEIAEAADIASKIMSGMGIAADDLGGTMDVLAKAMTTANTDILMLGEAFKYVGPIAKTAGIGQEDITGAIQLLSNAGMQGEQAGTILRGMILSLTSPSAEAVNTLKELGVRVNDARGNFRGLAPIIADFQRGLAGMGNAQQLGALGTVFGARQAAGAAELINQGADRMAAASDALRDAAGTAARISGIQLDTTGGSFDIVMSALEGLAITVGETLAPALRRAFGLVVDLTNRLAAFAEQNRGLVIALAATTAGLVAGGAALVALGVAAKVAAFAVGTLAGAVGLLTLAVRVSAASVAAVALAAGALRATVVATTTAIGLMRAAVLGTAAALKLFTSLAGLAKVATLALSGVTAVLTATVSPLAVVVAGFAALGGWLLYTGKASEALGWAGRRFDELRESAVAAFGGIRDALAAGDFRLAAKVAWLGIRVEFQKGVNWLNALWQDWGVAAQTVISNVQFAFARFGTNLVTMFTKALNNVSGLFQKAWEYIKALFTGEDLDAAFGRIDADVAARNAAASATGAGRIAALRDAQATADEARFAGARASLAAGDTELRRLEEELAAAVAEAAEKARPPDDETGGEGEGGPAAPRGPFGGLTPGVLDEAIDRTAAKTDVAGTFSAAAAAGMGAGASAADRTAEATETAAELLGRLNDRARQGRLVFAD